MIARVQGRSPDEPDAGYLPLRCVYRNDWQPIQRQPVASSDEAIQVCIRDVCDQLRRLDEFVRERLDVLRHNVARLVSPPERTTSVYIDGIPYMVDAGGGITLPATLMDEDSARGARKIGKAMVDSIVAIVTEQRNPDDVPVLADLMENEPLEVLTAVARQEPALPGDVAALMVRVCGENVRELAVKLEQAAAERMAELNQDRDADDGGDGDQGDADDRDAIPTPVDDPVAVPSPSIILDSPDKA